MLSGKFNLIDQHIGVNGFRSKYLANILKSLHQVMQPVRNTLPMLKRTLSLQHHVMSCHAKYNHLLELVLLKGMIK